MSATLSAIDATAFDIVELSLDEIAEIAAAGVVSNVSYTVGFALTGASLGATLASGGTLAPATAITGAVGVALIGVGAVADYYGY